MATNKFDVLPKKDMSKVKKDISDIKKKLDGKTIANGKKSLKLIPHEDVSEVKKDIKDIKKTLSSKLKTKKTRVKTTKFDNYYDLMPHKRITKLEEEVITLKAKLSDTKKAARKAKVKAPAARKGAAKKDSSSLEKSMNKLSHSINNLIRLFEIAGKAEESESAAVSSSSTTEISQSSAAVTVQPAAPSVESQDVVRALVELRDKIAELSAENEEMAKGILVIAEMLKESLPEKKQELDSFGKEFSGQSQFGQPEQQDDLPPLPPLESMPDTTMHQANMDMSDLSNMQQRPPERRRSLF